MTTMLGHLVLPAAAMLVAAPAAAQVAPDLTAKADAIVAASWPADGPGAAVIVTQGGRTVYASGRGLADVARRTPITPDTVFRLGSITKQFAAAVILQLVAEGKVSLDDPVSKFVPNYPQPGGSATVRQLLNHTSGIQSYTGMPGWIAGASPTRAYTTAEMIAVFRDQPSPFKPGQDHSYNNSGYVLVGAVIEAVTGKPWHVAIAERITKPLGLTSIRYGVDEASIPLHATPYTHDGKPARIIHMSVPHAAGALVGSVRDLAAWAQALHHGKVVRADLYAQMIAPTILPDGRSIPYGFGIQTGDVRGAKTIRHGGGIFGGSTESLYIPDRDIFVAVFANSDAPTTSPGVAAQRLAATAIGNPYPAFASVAVDPATLQPLLGVYAIADGQDQRRFYARGDQLFVQRTGGTESPVSAAGDDRFFLTPNSLTWFQIRRDPAGKHIMEMHQNGADAIERAVWSRPNPPEPAAAIVPRATLERYVGGYLFGRSTATIAMGEGDALTVQLSGQPAFPMRAVSASEFAVDRVGARIVFHRDGEAVTKLVLTQGGRDMTATRIVEQRK